MKLRTALTILIPLAATAFVPPHVSRNSVAIDRKSNTIPFSTESPSQRQVVILRSSRKDDTIAEVAAKSGKKVDSGVRKKLLAESIAPWRALRLFLYGSLGSGALLGGFITLSGVAAYLSGARSDADLNTEYLNLGIDFGAAAALGFLAKFDYDRGRKLDEEVETKLEKKKEQQKIIKGMKSREKQLSNLSLSIQVTVDGGKTDATIGAIQEGANQHIILVAGQRKAIKDALLGANLLKLDFSMSNILVVPYEIDEENEAKLRPSGGFGEQPVWETQPYVARITGEGWDSYIEAEMNDAVEQNGPKVKEEGIAIVVANDGKVIRRGVGKVPWRQMVEDLAEYVSPTKEDD